jgi:hypothetical protein
MSLCPECRQWHGDCREDDGADLAWLSAFGIALAISLVIGLGVGLILAAAP